ncbi:MAG: non-homologous end-joining DNA ligase [Acidimicrobiia bacterium]
MAESTYNRKRDFTETSEPAAVATEGDVDPIIAPTGELFVIHQHYATRLHHDLRLEMLNGSTPVLVSWAIPKLLPKRKGQRHLAVRTEDHPFEYASFSGSIPKGNYGAGEVRIFDTGRYEALERDGKKISFRLVGERVDGIFHLIHTRDRDGKQEWLALQGEDLRENLDQPPPSKPMLATVGDGPFDDPAWSFEPKWDGIRAIAVCGVDTTLISRNDNDITIAYPELRSVNIQLVAIDAVLDGEIVALDDGVPSFQKLQGRMHLRDPASIEKATKSNPVTYMVFDLLFLDGRNLVDKPLSERRQLLEEIIVPSDRVQISPAIVGEGTALFGAAQAQNLEGIVAKQLSSIYQPAARSRAWLKIKTVFDADAVVVGWTEGGGARSGSIGSLVLAMYEGDALRYVGNVGTGFNQKTMAEAVQRLGNLPTMESPFPASLYRERPELRRAHWVAPKLVATVEYRQVTSAGRLRVPSFKGFREDKAPAECTFDQLIPTGTP